MADKTVKKKFEDIESLSSQNEKLSAAKELADDIVKTKFDLSQEFQADTTFLQRLQSLLKNFLSDNQKDPSVPVLCLDLAAYNPAIVEPLVGHVSCNLLVLQNGHQSEAEEAFKRLFSLYQKLRQFPKLISRMIVKLKAASEEKTDLKIQPLSGEVADAFSSRILEIPVGQLLDLWRTLNYHLANDSDNGNVVELVNQLLSLLLKNACVVEQSIPRPTLSKVYANIEATSEAVQLISTKVPDVVEALAELVLVLKANRGFDQHDLKHLTKLQKRKLDSLSINSSPTKKLKLSWDDVKAEPGVWDFCLQDLSDKDVLTAVDQLKDEDIFLDNSRLQSALVFSRLSKLAKALPKTKLKTAIEKVVSNRDNWLQDNSENHLESEVSVLSSFIDNDCDLSKSLTLKDDSALDELLTAMAKLPVEHLQNSLGVLTTLIIVALLNTNSRKSSFMLLLAKSLDSTFRPSSILKHVNASKLLKNLASIPVEEEDHNKKLMETVLNSVAKLALTFQAPLDDLIENAKNIQDFWLLVVILENLEKSVTKGDGIKKEKIEKLGQLFETLSSTFYQKVNDNHDQSLVVRGLTAVSSSDGKKWKKLAKKFINTSVSNLASDGNSSCRQDYVKFIQILIRNHPDLLNEDDASKMFATSGKLFSRPPVSDIDEQLITTVFEKGTFFQKATESLVEATVRVQFRLFLLILLNDFV